MKKQLLLIPLLTLILSACMAKLYTPVPAGDARNFAPETARPSATATPTIVLSPTTDYKSTAEVAQAQADIAQATADEARRINAMATAEYMALENERLRMTQQVEQQQFNIAMWTETAAATSIPLTQTQQVIVNTRTAQQRSFAYIQMTATEHAPTQTVAMINAQLHEKYGSLDYGVGIFAKISVGILAVCIGIYLFKLQPKQSEVEEHQDEEPAPEEPVKETIVLVKHDNGPGSLNLQRFVVPCTPKQLTELAAALVQGEKTMAINQWEGNGTSFTRPVILQVRNWARQNNFALATEDNQLAPTNDFLNFLIGWLDNNRLPDEYKFGG